MIDKEYENDPIIRTPASRDGEVQFKIPLWEVAHFDARIIHWNAREAGIQSNWVAYRLVGHEYRLGVSCAYPVLIFAVLPIETPEHAPEGWSWTDE